MKSSQKSGTRQVKRPGSGTSPVAGAARGAPPPPSDEDHLRADLARAHARNAQLAADLDATKASLDAALEKDRELNAFNTTICAFIETIAGDGSSPQASPAKKKQPAVSL